MKKLLDKIINENSSRRRFMWVFGLISVESVVSGIVCGWLYNYFHHPVFLFVSIVDAVAFFLTFSYFGNMCVRLLQDWQNKR